MLSLKPDKCYKAQYSTLRSYSFILLIFVEYVSHVYWNTLAETMDGAVLMFVDYNI